MTNSVEISGKMEEVFNMTEGIMLGKLRCDGLLVDVFWREENFSSEYIEKSFVCIQGRLQHIEYRKEQNYAVTRRLAICVERMEVYDI